MADIEEAKIVEQVMHKVARENNIRNYELTIKPISSGGANYMSHLYVVTYTKQERKEDINVFAKIAISSERMRRQMAIHMYLTEIYFYTSIAKKYRALEELYEIKNEHKLNISKFYGHHEDLYQETVVLENLISRGFRMYDRMKSVDWEYAAAAMRELAKFHALSVAYQRADPRAFEEYETKFKNNAAQVDETRSHWTSVMKNSVQKLRPENKAVVQNVLDNGSPDITAYHKMFVASKQKVLVHGDYRPSNMMYRILENGTVELIPVDFQTMQTGSPVQDFIFFMVCATDEEFRKQYYDRMVDYYCDQLQAALARLKLDSSVYSKQDFLDELKEKLPFGLAYAFFLLPLLLVEEDKAPVVDKNLDITKLSVNVTSSLLEERLNGIVNDYRRWGVFSQI